MNNPVPENPDRPVPRGKIFPRNLTARADHVVRGNPAGSRPESGVDNCFPGLEFDQRNLDKCFFPGLTFDFHHSRGSRLIAVADGADTVLDLTSDDLQVTEQAPWLLHLWAVCGRTEVDQLEAQTPVFAATDRSGMSMWRFVHDLLPGRIAIRLGPRPGRFSPGEAGVRGGSLNALRTANESRVERDAAGNVTSAVLVADRADYLTDDGVIDPVAYLPGDLTRSLCAPWQYDFRECGCFYWAASKPDISASHDGKFHPLNFQRSGDRTLVPPELDGPRYLPRSAQELDHPALITNWNVLPVVLNGREDDSEGIPGPLGLTPQPYDKVVERLEHLARVEHALCLQYLYAHYSLNAPRELDPATPADAPVRKFFAAAQEVFAVAEDEMRHLRWVNEILGVLGRPIVLDPPTEAFVIQPETDTKFELEGLTKAQLNWFIKVEETSDQLNPEGIDGMYIRLHQTIMDEKETYPQAERLSHLIKLIIDEGVDHFARFTKVKAHLAGFSEATYVRTLTRNPTAPLDQRLLELGDLNYAMLLGALKDSLRRGDRAGGVRIEQARQAMTNFHEVNHLLASRGVAPRFTGPGPLGDGQALLASAQAAKTSQQTISSLDGPALGAMMARHQADTQTLIDALTP